MNQRKWLIFIVVAALVIAAAYGIREGGNTKKEIDKMLADIGQRREEAAEKLAEKFKTDPNFLFSKDAQLFISSSLFSDTLKKVDTFEFTLPSDKDVIVKIKSLRPSFTYGIAGIDIDATVRKDDSALDVRGLAFLLPKISAGASAPKEIRFNLAVAELAPDVSWSGFSAKVPRLLSEYAQWKLNDAIEKNLPNLSLKSDNDIHINHDSEEKIIPVFDGSYNAKITLPKVEWGMTFVVDEIAVLPRGIHLMGSLRQ